VVVGTAGAVSHHQQNKYAQKEAAAQEQYDQAYQQGAADAQQQAPPPEQYAAPVEPAPAGTDLTAQLQQLAQLHDSGILTDEEFAAAKQKLLAG
jgi:predicted lipid-binding transport protein (Tim44 family)